MRHAITDGSAALRELLPAARGRGAPWPRAAPRRITAVPVDLLMHSYRAQGEMTFGLEMEFEGRIDADILARAGALLLEAEPILGCRLVVDVPDSYWEPVAEPPEPLPVVTGGPADYARIRHSGIDATRQVQIALCLWRRPDGDCLLVRMTHEVGDGTALQYLVARLASIYSALCADPDHRPAANMAADRDLTQVLSGLSLREYGRIVWDFFRFIAPIRRPVATLALPLPTPATGPVSMVVRRVPAARVAYLSAFGKARRATLNDLFLAAAYRALAAVGKWDGTCGLRIPISVDLRRWAAVRERPCPISNQTSPEWPFLGCHLGADFVETLAHVSAVTARRKQGRPGFALAILAHLIWKVRKPSPTVAATGERPRRTAPELTFANEGALDRAGIRFGAERPAAARVLPPFFAAPRLHMSMSGYDGGLELLAVTSENCRPVVEQFFDALLTELPQPS